MTTKEKRNLIIESAIKLFSEKGFQATSTTSITKDAGIGTGTLFTYFSCKDDLINAAYLESKASMAAHLKEQIVEGDTVKHTLRALLGASIDWAMENKEKFSFLMQFGNSPYITAVTMEEAIGGFNFVLKVLEEGVKKDEVAEVPLQLYHSMIGGMIYGLFNYINESGADRNQSVEHAFNILWLGIRK